jgi:hypothetical protein
MEMIRDALSPERLEQMRKMLDHEHRDPNQVADELSSSLSRKRDDEQERRERDRWEKKRRRMAGVR